MTDYRTHRCTELDLAQEGQTVKVAGWMANVRDHGGLVFLDVRDHSGRLQVVLPEDAEMAGLVRGIGKESVIAVEGEVRARPEGTRNPNLATGDIELAASHIEVLGEATRALPFELSQVESVREDIRLRHRYLDMRTERLQRNLMLRSQVIQHIRDQMIELDFVEIQTPILTSSSPEGARDYLVPSRRYPGSFYALPQAPQQFKQLLMVGGVERYFQIAPCFRDEDGRADRSPGEFYQLDLEMAFATQEDVFTVVETVFDDLFAAFSERERTPIPFPRIPYAEAMVRYGTDKPDLRNPLVITDLTDHFATSDVGVFKGKTVRALRIPGGAGQGRRFFDDLTSVATDWGAKGMAWCKLNEDGTSGPIAKALTDDDLAAVKTATGADTGDALLFIADTEAMAARVTGALRTEVGERLELIEQDVYRFCWVVDFPMYERDEDTGVVDFSHNPFSMPQGGAEALEAEDPTSILAYQYDIVCNGYELSSGAVRNHDPKLMVKAFALAGYTEEEVGSRFGALYNAFQYGAPPHAGVAPGIDRILMLLSDEELIRDVIAFPMTVQARDLLMGAPAPVSDRQLAELNIRTVVPAPEPGPATS
ncbi:aspartate--tRNA ligase [Iamia sp. SCSIO 61187]|uniref:aspartate--tRNA ligase n=1 Tax=Iamia sp. SCSIO 61187 TaxID=2722752 RepID=UPI001C62E164|nr:aspartate--tRNA ligase [Iamia sp. SCSIO 61187]QYG94893.1 aspartate--tRNA ligase [Iamia sp. SCSIO 61187]